MTRIASFTELHCTICPRLVTVGGKCLYYVKICFEWNKLPGRIGNISSETIFRKTKYFLINSIYFIYVYI